jgi:hypothetical protein
LPWCLISAPLCTVWAHKESKPFSYTYIKGPCCSFENRSRSPKVGCHFVSFIGCD